MLDGSCWIMPTQDVRQTRRPTFKAKACCETTAASPCHDKTQGCSRGSPATISQHPQKQQNPRDFLMFCCCKIWRSLEEVLKMPWRNLKDVFTFRCFEKLFADFLLGVFLLKPMTWKTRSSFFGVLPINIPSKVSTLSFEGPPEPAATA